MLDKNIYAFTQVKHTKRLLYRSIYICTILHKANIQKYCIDALRVQVRARNKMHNIAHDAI